MMTRIYNYDYFNLKNNWLILNICLLLIIRIVYFISEENKFSLSQENIGKNIWDFYYLYLSLFPDYQSYNKVSILNYRAS